MVQIGSMPRKQRTREHIIADQSVNYVERFIIDEGHTTQRLNQDYGYDLLLLTYDEEGYAEPGVAFLQLKGAVTLTQSGSHYVYDLDIRDYNLWMRGIRPYSWFYSTPHDDERTGFTYKGTFGEIRRASRKSVPKPFAFVCHGGRL